MDIFKATGMQGVFANFSDLAIKLVNVFMTIVACAIVDRKGRKFLLKLGTSGIILGLCGVATTFLLITKGVVVASMTTGIVATAFFFMFIAFYAVGPGVCVWLALSELMPNRIRANGDVVTQPDRLINRCAGSNVLGRLRRGIKNLSHACIRQVGVFHYQRAYSGKWKIVLRQNNS